MKNIYTILLSLTLLSIHSQSDFSMKVSLAPLSLFDGIEGPNVKCGIEPQYKRLGLAVEGGIYFSKYGQGLNTRTTFKYYFGKELNYYVGMQYFYKDCTIPGAKQISVDSSKVNLSFKVHKIVNSLTINFGTTNQFFKLDHIYFDLFAGIGARHKNINQIGLTETENSAPDQREGHLIQSYYALGKKYTPDLIIGFRLYFYAL